MLTNTERMSPRDQAAKVAAAWEVAIKAMGAAREMATKMEMPAAMRTNLAVAMQDAIDVAFLADTKIVSTLEAYQEGGIPTPRYNEAELSRRLAASTHEPGEDDPDIHGY